MVCIGFTLKQLVLVMVFNFFVQWPFSRDAVRSTEALRQQSDHGRKYTQFNKSYKSRSKFCPLLFTFELSGVLRKIRRTCCSYCGGVPVPGVSCTTRVRALTSRKRIRRGMAITALWIGIVILCLLNQVFGCTSLLLLLTKETFKRRDWCTPPPVFARPYSICQ